MFPQKIFQFLGESFQVKFFTEIARNLGERSLFYLLLYSLMILFFSYFWVATQFNELQISDDLKKNGGYIPGVRPGQATSDFLHNAMSRITLAGALFLTVIAVIPLLMYNEMKIPFPVAQFLWRHEHAHFSRCHARHHAADGDPFADASLRRISEEGPPARTFLAGVDPAGRSRAPADRGRRMARNNLSCYAKADDHSQERAGFRSHAAGLPDSGSSARRRRDVHSAWVDHPGNR